MFRPSLFIEENEGERHRKHVLCVRWSAKHTFTIDLFVRTGTFPNKWIDGIFVEELSVDSTPNEPPVINDIFWLYGMHTEINNNTIQTSYLSRGLFVIIQYITVCVGYVEGYILDNRYSKGYNVRRRNNQRIVYNHS